MQSPGAVSAYKFLRNYFVALAALYRFAAVSGAGPLRGFWTRGVKYLYDMVHIHYNDWTVRRWYTGHLSIYTTNT